MADKPTTFQNLNPEKQERVLSVALDEFANHGFQGASVNRMVKTLGIAKGSLFQYFGNKQGMFEQVFARGVERFKGPLRRVREETADQPFFDRLRVVLLTGVDFIRRHPLIYRMYLKILYQESMPLRDRLLSEVRLSSARFLRPLVVQGIERGDLRPDTDPDMALFLIDAVFDRFLQATAQQHLDCGCGIHGADAPTLEQCVDDIMLFLRFGMSGAAQGDDQ